MDKEDFLQIFKSGFHKLTLKKVVKIGKGRNKTGRSYDICLGLFEFVPPEQVWMDEAPFDYGFLKSLLAEFDKELSNVIVHQYKRTVFKNGESLNQVVRKYVFDIVPKNIVDFRLYRDTKTMRLVAKGYCLSK